MYRYFAQHLPGNERVMEPVSPNCGSACSSESWPELERNLATVTACEKRNFRKETNPHVSLFGILYWPARYTRTSSSGWTSSLTCSETTDFQSRGLDVFRLFHLSFAPTPPSRPLILRHHDGPSAETYCTSARCSAVSPTRVGSSGRSQTSRSSTTVRELCRRQAQRSSSQREGEESSSARPSEGFGPSDRGGRGIGRTTTR